MTPSERSLLQQVGTITLNNLARLSIYTLLYGIFILLTGISVKTFTRRGLMSFPKRMMLSVTIICFILASLFWGAYVAGFVIQIRRIFADDGLPDGAGLEAINRELFPLEEIQYWTLLIAPLISDGVVIWRAWVIFGQQRWLMAGPLTLLLGTTATSLAYAVITSRYSMIIADQLGHNHHTINLYNAFLALSLATNTTTTLLILYKLWILRTEMHGLSLSQKPTQVQKVLIVIVESGIVFCLLQALSLIPNFLSFPLDSPSYMVETTIVAAYTFITPMYPTLVVVMVNQQSTVVETFGISTALRSDLGWNIEDGTPPSAGPMADNWCFTSTHYGTTPTGSLPTQETRTYVSIDGNALERNANTLNEKSEALPS